MRKAIMVIMIMAIAGGVFAQNLGNSMKDNEYTPEDYLGLPALGIPCSDCPPDGLPEGEPELVDDYVDILNGGCNSIPPVFQDINWGLEDTGVAELCGMSGWYLFEGETYRDTDWFTAIANGNEMVFTVESAFEVAVYQLQNSVLDCVDQTILQGSVATCETPLNMVIPTTPGQVVNLFVAPTVFVSPDGSTREFPYFATLTGHLALTVATEEVTWGGVKALYR